MFAGIPKCLYCGAPIKFHSNGDAKSFICSTVLDGRGCFRTGWSCSDFELSFFSFVEHNKVDADLQALLRSHRVANRQNAGAQILELRIGIAALLKSKIIRLAVASSGPSPQPTELEGRIRRNAPGRYFQLQFKGGPVHSVYPPQPRRGPGLDRVHLANALNLSPRQADITTLLAEGLSLTQLAEELDIGLETARWHLREVFRRTNTHSQAELPARASKTYGAATDGVQSGRT